MKRALLIAPYFPPWRRVGALRPWRFATGLREFGWQPAIVRLHPGKETLTPAERALLGDIEVLDVEGPGSATLHRLRTWTPPSKRHDVESSRPIAARARISCVGGLSPARRSEARFVAHALTGAPLERRAPEAIADPLVDRVAAVRERRASPARFDHAMQAIARDETRATVRASTTSCDAVVPDARASGDPAPGGAR